MKWLYFPLLFTSHLDLMPRGNLQSVGSGDEKSEPEKALDIHLAS